MDKLHYKDMKPIPADDALIYGDYAISKNF